MSEAPTKSERRKKRSKSKKPPVESSSSSSSSSSDNSDSEHVDTPRPVAKRRRGNNEKVPRLSVSERRYESQTLELHQIPLTAELCARLEKDAPGKTRHGTHLMITESGTRVIGNHNLVMAPNCEIIGDYNTVIGNNNRVEGNFCRVCGTGIIMKGANNQEYKNPTPDMYRMIHSASKRHALSQHEKPKIMGSYAAATMIASQLGVGRRGG